MNLAEQLNRRIDKKEIDEICKISQIDSSIIESLFNILNSSNLRIAENAAWILTHIKKETLLPFETKRRELEKLAINTTSTTLKRLILSILTRLQYSQNNIDANFVDFCLGMITNKNTTPGIAALCIKLAYNQSRFFEPLNDELLTLLSIMPDDLKPAVASARKNILKKIKATS